MRVSVAAVGVQRRNIKGDLWADTLPAGAEAGIVRLEPISTFAAHSSCETAIAAPTLGKFS